MSIERVFGRFPTGSNGQVQVSRSAYRGRNRIDLREFFPSEGGELKPTRRGVTLPLNTLPALRAALEQAEADALRLGLLEAGAQPTRNDHVPDLPAFRPE